MFFALDGDFDGRLSFEELSLFGRYVLGGEAWDLTVAKVLTKQPDAVDADGALEFDQFCIFAEQTDGLGPAPERLQGTQRIADGFLQVLAHHRAARRALWRVRAVAVDRAARWTIPAGFAAAVGVLFR